MSGKVRSLAIAAALAGAVGAPGPHRTARASDLVHGYEGKTKEILRSVARRYRSLKTYRDRFEVVVATDLFAVAEALKKRAVQPGRAAKPLTTQPATRSDPRRGSVVFERPGKFLVDGPRLRAFSDGRQLKVYDKTAGKVRSEPLPMDRGRPVLSGAKGLLRRALAGAPQMTLLLADDAAREMLRAVDRIELDEPARIAGADCYVLHAHGRALDVTYYIDRKTHLVRSIVTDLRRRADQLLGGGGATKEAQIVLTILEPRIDAAYAPETFQYRLEAALAPEPIIKVKQAAPPLESLGKPETGPTTRPKQVR